MLKKELKSVFISLFGYSWDLDKRLYLRYEYATGIWIDVKLNDKTYSRITRWMFGIVRLYRGIIGGLIRHRSMKEF